MKDAMRNKDRRTSTLMRMIKSKVTERTTSKEYQSSSNPPTGDALWQEVIEAYVKASTKVLADYLKLGEDGAEHADQVQWEIDALQEYMPQLADEAQTRVWVREAIEKLGGAESAVVGRVMGEVMKAHKGEVDPGLTNKVAREELA
jgi:hypothetical protein